MVTILYRFRAASTGPICQLQKIVGSFFFCSIKQWTENVSRSVQNTTGDIAKSATLGSANTMKGVIVVENATPISASMVDARIAARSVGQECVSTTKSRRGVGSATLARRKEHLLQQLSPILIWKLTTFAWSSQRGSSNPSLGNARQLSSSRL